MNRRILFALLLLLTSLGCEGEPAGGSGEILATEEKLYSQGNEELIIRDFFGDRRDGFFLDVGCWHWKRASTTYYLEKHLGWSGIGVDAIADFAADYARERPRTRFFNYFVSDESDEEETFYRVGKGTNQGALSSSSKKHVEAMAKGRWSETQVRTITLNDLLDREGVEEIDLLSMDIEQSEPAALRGFDIERFRPKLVCIEAAPAVREFITGYFDEHGYERIEAYLEHDPVNWYYRPSSGS